MATASKLDRCLRLFASFQRQGSLTVADACRIGGVDRQTARRDLKSLQDAGVPVEVQGHGPERRFVLPSEHRREGLLVTKGDVYALHFGRQLLSFVEGTVLTEWLDELGRKLDVAKPPRTAELEARFARRLVFLSEPYRAYGAADEALNQVLTALLGERLLELEYASRSGPRHWKRVEPLALVIYRRALYLMASLGWGDVVLRLAVDRITSATCTKLPFRYPEDFDARAELARNFGIYDDQRPPERVRIRFGPQVADLVQARTWHPTASVTIEPGGEALLELFASGVELARLVLEFGASAEVLEPPWLREEVEQELRAALSRYG